MLTQLDVSCSVQSSFPSVFAGFEDPDTPRDVTVDVTEGRDVALECMVGAAQPPPEIEWFMGDTLIGTNEDLFDDFRAVEDGRYLVVRDLDAAKISARYHCEVTNARSLDRVRSPVTYVLQNRKL